MQRQSLRIVIVLGILVTVLGGTGIFAVFNDRATAGDNAVTSGARPKAADLRIEAGVLAGGTVNCDADLDGIIWEQDDTTTAQFTVTGAQPGASLGTSYVCLRNVGSAALTVTSSAIDLVDQDTECTGDEAGSGDVTCGLDSNLTPQAGELSPLLSVTMERVVCESPDMPFVVGSPQPLDQFTNVAFGGPGAIAPDEIVCVGIDLAYPTPASETDAQVAQSDQATWRFAFDGVAN